MALCKCISNVRFSYGPAMKNDQGVEQMEKMFASWRASPITASVYNMKLIKDFE
jgi:phosphoserine aminotransferase